MQLSLGKAAVVDTDETRDVTAIPMVAVRPTTAQDGTIEAVSAALLFLVPVYFSLPASHSM